MDISVLQTSICQTNTYIAVNNGGAIVIDPGGDAAKIVEAVSRRKAAIEYVLITHCHFDHVGAVHELQAQGAKVIMSRVDYLLLEMHGFDFELNGIPGTAVKPFKVDKFVSDGDRLNLCGIEFTVISTPGHTPGGVSYVADGIVFSGDTLFEGSVGRTDFPYCDETALCGSVKRLFALDGNYTVLSGHGGATELAAERIYNRYAFYKDVSTDTELADVAKLFFGDDAPDIYIADFGDRFDVLMCDKHFRYMPSTSELDDIPEANKTGRLLKIALYEALKAHTGREMPWGALTGVRPSKLFYECIAGGKSPNEAQKTMTDIYRVSRERADILSDIYEAQKGKIFFPDDHINLYVHIPYCTTRCSYCSFVSAPISKCAEQSVKYVDLLCEEIEHAKDILARFGKKILSVYIGGGTPTALGAVELKRVLTAAKSDCEFTCEAGRPDTISEEKVNIMREAGVTRVCVNPQTLCDKTLVEIGRSHTVDDFYRAYEAVERGGFDINCDLIAGLGSETVIDFAESFDGIVRLNPQNITVHSLAKKNGSGIRYEKGESRQASAMIDYAFEHIGQYRPYYLYRQKRQAGNLENVGFSLPGKECVNNITTMEETVGIMACGAGAISKFVGNGRISRFADMRDVSLYIERFHEKLKEKQEFFESNFGHCD